MQTRLVTAGGQLAFQLVRCPSSAKVSTKHCCTIFPVIISMSNLWFPDVDVCVFENLIVCVLQGPLLLSGGTAMCAKSLTVCISYCSGQHTHLVNQHAPKLTPRLRRRYHHALSRDCRLLLETPLVVRCHRCMVSNLSMKSVNISLVDATRDI